MAHAAQLAVLLWPLGNPRISARLAADSVLPSCQLSLSSQGHDLMCETSVFLCLLI